jgi:serine/threonine-protein kinase
VKVVDFGIAKAATGSSETKTGVLKGKLTYMAPEQARSGRVDRRADLFSVGVMLWESVTGKRMWADATEVQILHMLTTGEIPPARQFVPDLPRELEAILARSLAFSPRDRYETAVDFSADIERYMQLIGERVSSRDLAEFVSSLFSDKRAEIKALIERQLRGVSTSMSAPSLSSTLPQLDALNATGTATHSHLVAAQLGGSALPPPGSPPTRLDIPASLAQVEVSGFLSAVPGLTRPESDPYALTASPVTSTGLPPSPGGSSKKSGFVLGVGVAVGLLAVAGIGALALTGRPDATNATTVPSPTSSAPLSPSAAVDPGAVAGTPTATGALIRVKTTPPEAKVFIDDGLLPGTPPTARFPKDGASRKVRVEAPGYVTKTEYVTCDGDKTLDFVLDRPGRPGSAPATTVKGHKEPEPPVEPTGDKPPTTTTKRGKTVRDLDNDDPWAHPKLAPGGRRPDGGPRKQSSLTVGPAGRCFRPPGRVIRLSARCAAMPVPVLAWSPFSSAPRGSARRRPSHRRRPWARNRRPTRAKRVLATRRGKRSTKKARSRRPWSSFNARTSSRLRTRSFTTLRKSIDS